MNPNNSKQEALEDSQVRGCPRMPAYMTTVLGDSAPGLLEVREEWLTDKCGSSGMKALNLMGHATWISLISLRVLTAVGRVRWSINF